MVIQQILQILALVCWFVAAFFTVSWSGPATTEGRPFGFGFSPLALGFVFWGLSVVLK